MTVLCNAKVWLDRYDLSGALNACGVEDGVEEVDDTTLYPGCTRIYTAGLWSSRFAHSGYWRKDAQPDLEINRRLGLNDTPMSVSPHAGGAEGSVAYFMNSLLAAYNPNGQVGAQFAFSVNAESQARMIRGEVAHNAVQTASGSGAAIAGKAVAAGQRLAAALHVLEPVAGTGPNLEVIIESSPDAGFSAPTVRIPFLATGVATAEYQEDPTESTDTFYRVSWSITGPGASFPFVVVFGIYTHD